MASVNKVILVGNLGRDAEPGRVDGSSLVLAHALDQRSGAAAVTCQVADSPAWAATAPAPRPSAIISR